MKIIHVPFAFFPDPVGGTEVYVEALARQQQRLGAGSLVAAPSEMEGVYEHRGLKVLRFPVKPVTELQDLYGEGDALAAESFGRLLDAERPDVVHLHAFTRAVSLRLVREAKRRNTPVVFSYHTPTVSCLRGTLMYWGETVCDGVIDASRCTACAAHGLGVPKPLARLLPLVPRAIRAGVAARGLSGGAWTGVRLPELITLRHDVFRALTREVDHIVALCDWVKTVLLRNDVPSGKITVSRQGLADAPYESPTPCSRP